MKRNTLYGIGIIATIAFSTLNFNPSDSQNGLSLSNLRTISNAIAECDDPEEGYVCSKDANDEEYCVFGGEWGAFCPPELN
jgi:hypothetical protein